MPLELMKEYLEVNQEIDRFNTQTIIEESVIVPDFKPDIEKVLSVKGQIHVNNKVMEGSKFFIEGMVNCNILYQTKEDEIKLQNINTEIPFSHTMEVEDEEGLESTLETNMEYLDYELINTRKLSLRGVLGMKGKFTKKQQYPLLNDIKGLEDMQMLRNWVKITTIADKAKDQTMIKEQIDLGEMPSVVEIIKTQAKVNEKEIKLGQGQIMTNGTVDVEFLYIGEANENQSIEYVEYQMPFTHIIELPNVTEDMEYQLSFNVEEVLTQIQSNEEGVFNIIDIEALVGVEGVVYQDYEVETIVDAYSPSVQTQLNKERIDCQRMIANEKAQRVVKEKLSTPVDQDGMEHILSVSGEVKITDSQRQEDRWVVEGILDVEVLYKAVGEEEKYGSIQTEIPFNNVFELDAIEEIQGDVSVNIQHIGYQLISSDEVDLKVVLNLQCQLFKPVVFYGIEEIEELDEVQEEDSKEAKISVYFKQPKDSLWEIAKRYRITMEEVINQNDIEDQENIPNYTPIIISKSNTISVK